MRRQWIAAAVTILTATSFASGQQLPDCKLEPEIDAPKVDACQPDDGCLAECCCCQPWQERFWFNTEYLLFWLRTQNLPVPLVTTSPAGTTPALGLPTTSVLSPDNFNYGAISGIRLNAGTWFRRNPRLGFLASGFLMEQANASFAFVDPSGASNIGQPFLTPGGPGSSAASTPGAFGGGVIASARNRLWGSEANLVGQLVDNDRWNVSLLGGFRYLDMAEYLDIDAPAVNLVTNAFAPVGTFSNFHDEFDTRNQFYGGQLGSRLEYRRNRLFVNSTVKLAMGSTHQTVNTLGSTLIATPGLAPALTPAGFYVTPGFNQGSFTRDRFAVVPELQLNVGYQLNRYLSAYAGYNFLYWSNVERPADQIDINFSPTQPVMPQDSTDFWMHGMNFGLGVRF